MSAHPSYRPDIDGLRALAVVPVLMYHAAFPGFSGGFVGVDIFFVISGYLITKIIAGTIENDKFSLLRFYHRRLLRIAPAATFMILATFVACCFILPPEEMRLFGNSILAAVAFVANFYFWGSSGYFDAVSSSKPLLHLWSLSVEEQFYFLFPIAMCLLYKTGKSTAKVAIVMGFSVSLVWAQYMVATDPTGAFYSPLSRTWELLLGSILAIGIVPVLTTKLVDLAASTGIGMIVFSVLFYSQSTPFPGLSAVVPSLGAALIIWAGMGSAIGTASKLLGSRPLVLIGLVSFSLYLWHWPILVLSSIYLDRSLIAGEAAAALAIAVAISIASYRFIEQPFRQRTEDGRPPILPFVSAGSIRVLSALALLGITGASGLALRFTDGLPVRASEEALLANAAITDLSKFARPCFSLGGELRGPKGCLSGASADSGNYDVIVWGDSHAEHIFPAIAEASAKAGRTARLMAKSSCPPLIDVFANIPGQPEAAVDCSEFVKQAFEVIEQASPDSTVVLASAWSGWTDEYFLSLERDGNQSAETSRQLLTVSLAQTLRAIRKQGHPVLLVRQVPRFPQDPAMCAARAAMVGRSSEQCFTVASADAKERLERSNAAVDKALVDASDVAVFDPADELCSGETCSARVGSLILYRDAGHLSASGSTWLGKAINLP